MHSRKLIVSGRTEASRKVVTLARTNGVLQEIHVQRGSKVKKGDIIAVLSDDAREAQVQQARALLDQRQVELDGRIVDELKDVIQRRIELRPGLRQFGPRELPLGSSSIAVERSPTMIAQMPSSDAATSTLPSRLSPVA